MSETNGTRKPKNKNPESSELDASLDYQGESDGGETSEDEDFWEETDDFIDDSPKKKKNKKHRNEIVGEEYSMPSSEITVATDSPNIMPVPELANLTEEEWAPPEDTLDDFDPEPEKAPLDLDWMLNELENPDGSGFDVSDEEAMELAMKVAGLESPPSESTEQEKDDLQNDLTDTLASIDTQPFEIPSENEEEEESPEEEEDIGSVDLDQLSMMLDDDFDQLDTNGDASKEEESPNEQDEEEEQEDDDDVVDLFNDDGKEDSETDEPEEDMVPETAADDEEDEEGIDLASLAAELGLDDEESASEEEPEQETEEQSEKTEETAGVPAAPAVIALGPVEGMETIAEEEPATEDEETTSDTEEEDEEESSDPNDDPDTETSEEETDDKTPVDETEESEVAEEKKEKKVGGMDDKEYLPSFNEDGVAVWKPKYVPIDELDIPVKIKKKLEADNARKMLLARNLVPMNNYEMGYTLYLLMNDENEAVRKAATKSLTEMPAAIMRPIAEQKLPNQILDWIARSRFSEDDPDRIIETIVFNSVVGDHTLEALVTICSETILDIISRNQVRMQRSPQLIFLFPYNPNTTIGLLNRVLEFAKRQRLINEEEEERLILQFENRDNPDWEAEVDPDSAAAKLKEAVPETRNEDGTLDWDFPGFMTDDFDSILDLDADAEIIDDKIKQKKDMRELIREMSVPQKLRLAVRGNMEARKILIDDRLQLVAVAVLKSPRITRTEIERAAESKTVQPEVIQAIAKDASAMRNYQTRWALVQNPKTPIQISTQIMGTLREKEIKILAKSKAVSQAVSTIARQKREIAEQRQKRRQKKKK